MKNDDFEMPKWTALVVIAPFLSAYLWRYQMPYLHSLTLISPYIATSFGIILCGVIAYFILKKGYLGSPFTLINYFKTLFISLALFYGSIAYSFLALNYYIRWPLGEEIVSPIIQSYYVSHSPVTLGLRGDSKCLYISVMIELENDYKEIQLSCKIPIEKFTKIRLKRSRGLLGFSVLHSFEPLT